MQETTEYLVGSKGVNVVASPLHTPEGALLSAQNVAFTRLLGVGGLASRGGIAPLTASPLAGPVLSLTNVPLALPGEFDLMVGLNSGETNAWKKSSDGTTYTNLATTVLERLSVGYTSLWGSATIPRDPRSVSFRGKFYYPGDNYVVDTSAPPVVVYNGTVAYEQFRVPSSPVASGVPRWISDFQLFGGLIYFSVFDNGGSAPDHKGRVFAFDPSAGTLLEIGNRFGNGSGENTKGFPFCVTSYLGQLWAGTYGISGNNQGGVYRIRPGIDETWTLDLTATLHNGYYMSLCPYKGLLFAATDADSSGTAIIQKRTSVGAWSTSFTAPAGNVSFCGSLCVFNNLLFAGYYNANTPKALIKVYDGTSWTTDKDITVDVGATLVPGKPFAFLGNLYWPLYSLTSDSATTGVLLKRTTGGVWSSALTATGLRGGLGQYAP